MPFTHLKPIVLVVASNGYQPIEYEVPRNFLQKEGWNVITASDQAGIAVASNKSTTSVDLMVSEINLVDYNGIFFIGGSGALKCLDNQISYDLIMKAHDLGVPYGAICISPRILAKAGALRWRHATGWNEDKKLEQIFAQNDATYEPVPVVIDGKIVTAEDPKAAEQFAQAILRVVTDYSVAVD